MSCDMCNAYLNVLYQEKIWCVIGAEFGSDKGKIMIKCHALYGFKSSGASWRATFTETLNDIGYTSSRADPDLWIKPKVKSNSDDYYSLILVYVDDVLHFDHEPNELMNLLEDKYRIKDKAEAPVRYLGTNIDKIQLPGGDIVLSMSSYDYVSNAINLLHPYLGVN